jgi:hypothetical protein
MFVISPQKPIKLYWNQTIIGTLFVVVRGPLMMGCGAEPTAISVANVSAYPDGNVVTVWRCGD